MDVLFLLELKEVLRCLYSTKNYRRFTFKHQQPALLRLLPLKSIILKYYCSRS